MGSCFGVSRGIHVPALQYSFKAHLTSTEQVLQSSPGSIAPFPHKLVGTGGGVLQIPKSQIWLSKHDASTGHVLQSSPESKIPLPHLFIGADGEVDPTIAKNEKPSVFDAL